MTQPQLQAVIRNGKGSLPPFVSLTPARMNALLDYVTSLK